MRIFGLQHVGMPTKCFDKTIKFYEALGFTSDYSTINGKSRVNFLSLGNLQLEIYEEAKPAMTTGAIDHLSLDVDDIHEVKTFVESIGLTVEKPGIETLPFFKNGVSFFKVIGPNKETLEFNQIN